MSRTSAPVHDGACPAVSAAAPLSVGFGQRIPFILLFKESEICVMRFSRPCAFPSDFAFLCPVRPRLFPPAGDWLDESGAVLCLDEDGAFAILSPMKVRRGVSA